MIEAIVEFYTECISFYGEFLSKKWQTISPMEYGSILIAISVVGWVFMKNSNKK